MHSCRRGSGKLSLQVLFILVVGHDCAIGQIYRTRRINLKIGELLLSASMAVSLVFGLGLHFGFESPDLCSNAVREHRTLSSAQRSRHRPTMSLRRFVHERVNEGSAEFPDRDQVFIYWRCVFVLFVPRQVIEPLKQLLVVFRFPELPRAHP